MRLKRSETVREFQLIGKHTQKARESKEDLAQKVTARWQLADRSSRWSIWF